MTAARNRRRKEQARRARGAALDERKPLTSQRSLWTQRDPGPAGALLPGAELFTREVHDGTLRALVGNEQTGWHLSISFVDRRGNPSRYPTWDEIADARDLLLPADVGFSMILPTAGEYVAVHDSTFHLHQLDRCRHCGETP